MSAIRIRSLAAVIEKLGQDVHVEVWGDGVVWLYDDAGHRLRFREWADGGYQPIAEWPTEAELKEWADAYG